MKIGNALAVTCGGKVKLPKGVLRRTCNMVMDAVGTFTFSFGALLESIIPITIGPVAAMRTYVEKTFTENAHFTPLAHCSISDAIVPGLYNFADDATGTGKDDFSDYETGNGSVTINSGKLKVSTNTNNSNWRNGPCALLADAANGDCDIQMHVDISNVSNDGGAIIAVASDGVDYETAGARLQFYTTDGGTNTEMQASYFNSGTAAEFGALSPSGDPTAVYIRITRSTNTWSWYYKVNAGDTWTQIGSSYSQSLTSTIDVYLGAQNLNSGTAEYVEYDDLTFVGGFNLTAKALIHDASDTVMDLGAGREADNSTFAETTTGSPTVSHKFADYDTDQAWTAAQAEANASWSAAKTEAQMQAESDTGKRFRYHMVEVQGNSGDTLDSISLDAMTV